MDDLKDIIENAIKLTGQGQAHVINVPELKRALMAIESEIANLKRRLDGQS